MELELNVAVGDVVKILPHKILAEDEKLSSFSGKLARVVSIDPPVYGDEYTFLHVYCGPDFFDSYYYVRSDEARLATEEERSGWVAPSTDN